jgi:hypothetical protein
MANVIIENIVQIAATLLITLIGVLGAWLSTKLAKREELKNITVATNEVIKAAQTTVLELQQTTVDGMKAANADGKLTKDEIAELGKLLIDGAMAKMSDTTKNLLNSAGVDISAIITGAGEALIARMK